MSLRIWLPLTKDLRQQGLSNVTVTNNGATFNSAGKLGGCYEFASGKRIQTTLPSTSNLNSKAISFACWVNISSWNSSYDCLMSIADGTGWQQSRATLCRNNTASTLCWNIADGNTSTRVYTTTSLSTNTWYHIACTYDGASLKIYVNGTLNNSTAATLSIGYAGTFNIGGWSGNNYPINCKMSDVRVYSHCLSPMEVKELAKGLVLHYSLNRQGWGQENLLRGSNVIGSGTTIYGWVSNGSATNMEILSDGSLHYKYNISNSKYIPSITTNTVVPCEFSKTYFYSMDLKFDKAITLGTSVPMHYWVGARNSNSITNTSCNGNLTGIQTQFISNHSGTLPANTWVHITTKFTFPAAATSSGYNYPAIRCFVYGSVLTETTTGEVNVWMKNCKVEEGSIETPWCPHIEDALATTMGLNSTTEYDCSGFCNNGTRIGTFTWTSDTPKYLVSQVFNGTDNAIQTPNLTTMITDKNYTIACWTYKTVIGTKNYQTIYGGPSGFELEARSGSSTSPLYRIHNWGGGTTAYNFGEWTHFCFVHTDSDSKLYVNGELKITGTSVNIPSGNYFVGAWNTSTSQNYEGNMSDFRIYATALSADDVKSLYQNCATIDPDGTIRGQIRS